eukprot:gene10278-biopygen10283
MMHPNRLASSATIAVTAPIIPSAATNVAHPPQYAVGGTIENTTFQNIVMKCITRSSMLASSGFSNVTASRSCCSHEFVSICARRRPFRWPVISTTRSTNERTQSSWVMITVHVLTAPMPDPPFGSDKCTENDFSELYSMWSVIGIRTVFETSVCSNSRTMSNSS